MAFKATLIMDQQKTSAAEVEAYNGKKYELVECEYEFYQSLVLKTVDIRSPKTGISVHFSYSLPMAMQIY